MKIIETNSHNYILHTNENKYMSLKYLLYSLPVIVDTLVDLNALNEKIFDDELFRNNWVRLNSVYIHIYLFIWNLIWMLLNDKEIIVKNS